MDLVACHELPPIYFKMIIERKINILVGCPSWFSAFKNYLYHNICQKFFLNVLNLKFHDGILCENKYLLIMIISVWRVTIALSCIFVIKPHPFSNFPCAPNIEIMVWYTMTAGCEPAH